MKDTTIVLQGKVFANTVSTAVQYLNLDFVERVIISTWLDNTVSTLNNDRVTVIKSAYPENGTGNMNLQILSSLNGLKLVSAPMAIKMRADQCIVQDDMYKLKRYVDEHIGIDIQFHDNDKLPKGSIFALGMNRKFPFHPQDHVFWGYTEDLLNLFDIPLMTLKNRRVGNNFSVELRCPIYLGANYFTKFNPQVQYYIDNFKEYLVDQAPKRDEAMQYYEKVRDRIFKVFPRIKMHWEKYGWPEYPYDMYAAQGEYYAD